MRFRVIILSVIMIGMVVAVNFITASKANDGESCDSDSDCKKSMLCFRGIMSKGPHKGICYYKCGPQNPICFVFPDYDFCLKNHKIKCHQGSCSSFPRKFEDGGFKELYFS